MLYISCIDAEGKARKGNVPPSASPELVTQMIRNMAKAGCTDIRLSGERGEIMGERFISLDEQRAAMTAIEEEKLLGNVCPDCGGRMEYDGGYPYCEYCEG